MIWDGLPPDTLPVSQQQAMLDWLHWGGQIVLIGGAGPTLLDLPRELPGALLARRPTGDNAQLSESRLRPLSRLIRRRAWPPRSVRCRLANPATEIDPAIRRSVTGRRYRSARRRTGRFSSPGCGRARGPRPFRWGSPARICWPSRAGSAAAGSPCWRSTPPTPRSRRGRGSTRSSAAWSCAGPRKQ